MLINNGRCEGVGDERRIMNIAEKAIKNNEMVQLLEGKDGYHLENDSWASISAPIDWTIVVPMIYQAYEKTRDDDIRKMFEKALMTMLNGNAEDVFCGVAVLYFQILRESFNRSPFMVNRTLLLKQANEGIRKNENDLKQIKKWGGEKSSEGLWKEVQRYRRLFLSKFNISI